jgi:hypothetical protein
MVGVIAVVVVDVAIVEIDVPGVGSLEHTLGNFAAQPLR